MRPEISRVVKEIYPALQDDPSVADFPDIKGTNGKNYFFLNHNFKEDNHANFQSKTNSNEADLIVRFCLYLILQNYLPSDITILSLYSGQLHTIHSKITKQYPPEHLLRKVRISTVDNYQGEENKIIILSLVRNNHND